MYERRYGYQYDALGDHPTNAEIAKQIRADIKLAKAEGLLPTKWSYSVRSDHLSVDLEVRDCADAWEACDGGQGCHNVWCSARNDPKYAHASDKHMVLTEEAKAAKMTLERIHNAYNHDGSEIQVDYFDVRYYGHVEFESADSAAWRAKEKAEKAAAKAAKEAGTVVGRMETYQRDGSSKVHVLIERTDGKTVYACGARAWRGGLRQRVADDTTVTCSRCAKRAQEVTA